MIGIIGAMEEEISMLIGQMKNRDVKEMAAMTFHHGILWDQETVVVRSGIGKVNMAVCTQILVDIYKVDAVINTGVAGGLYEKLHIGDIVISTDALQHDMDATGFGYKPGEIPRMETSIFPADKALADMAEAACRVVNPEIQCFRGRIVTGDQFISSNEKKQELIRLFDGYCAEMEGAAMAQTAYLNHVPFIIIRAISDNADNSAEMSYEQFEEQAIVHTMKLLAALFMKLKEN
ncbi:MAG: 5'-methylthioadenosine/adenosylhomocysteine nucleosidase [Lachnospiraceae bacterium]|nr:5'-methylthioadenosine/adenosylhomocysteine nucleosidase [Lachnospiraceae bacterium]